MPQSARSLRDWFLYTDRNKPQFDPTCGTNITIERLWDSEQSNIESQDWQREEWLIRSALVPVEQLSAAFGEIPSPHYLSFELGWNSQDEFSFGDHSKYRAINLYPLVLAIKHPITEEYRIQPNSKFLMYHALLELLPNQYYHPLDNVRVVDSEIETHKFLNPTARVAVHRDYLRDFLAVMKMGLLISVVADRFANTLTEDELELTPAEDVKIDDFSSLTAYKHHPESTHHGHFTGRSIIHRTYVVEPYDHPRYERSPWYFFGKLQIDKTQLPLFIVDNEGNKRTLPQNVFFGEYIENGIGNFGYLYFRPEVLQKFINIRGYSVFFHMRNWGIASLPGDRGTVDVGVNSQGMVNAFAPDIAKLSIAEQAYWASFSSLPSGEVCEEMFQTRMQQKPPHSPGVVDILRNCRTLLSDSLKKKYNVAIHNPIDPSALELSRLSVGPLTNQYSELLELARIMYGWLIETIRIDSLRLCLSTAGQTIDKRLKELRQIKLLEKILVVNGLDETEALSATSPLVGLNELRIGSAHIGSLELEHGFQLMGALATPSTPREGWNFCVDSVARSFQSIVNQIGI
jgi:hypothetical protein